MNECAIRSVSQISGKVFKKRTSRKANATMEMKKKGGHEGKNGVDVEMEIEGPNDINFAIAHGCNHNICSPNRSTVNHRWSAFNSLQFTLARMSKLNPPIMVYLRQIFRCT